METRKRKNVAFDEAARPAGDKEGKDKDGDTQQGEPSWTYHDVDPSCEGCGIREALPTMAHCVYTDRHKVQRMCLYGGQIDSRVNRQSEPYQVLLDHEPGTTLHCFQAKYQLASGSVYTSNLPSEETPSRWERQPSLPPRAKHSIIAVHHKVYSMGGFVVEQSDRKGDAQLVTYANSVLCFDPGNTEGYTTMHPIGDAPYPCVSPALAANISKNEIYLLAAQKGDDIWDPVCGAQGRGQGVDRWAHDNVYVLNIQSLMWTYIQIVKPIARVPHGMGKIGYDGESMMATAEMIYPTDSDWKTKTTPDAVEATAYMGFHANCMRDKRSETLHHHRELSTYHMLPAQFPIPRRKRILQYHSYYHDDAAIQYRNTKTGCEYKTHTNETNVPGLNSKGLDALSLEEKRLLFYKEGVKCGTHRTLGMTKEEWRVFSMERRMPYVPAVPLVSKRFLDGVDVVTPEMQFKGRSATAVHTQSLRWKTRRLSGIPHLPVLQAAEFPSESGSHLKTRQRVVYCLCVADSCVKIARGDEGVARMRDQQHRSKVAEKNAQKGSRLDLLAVDNGDYTDACRVDRSGRYEVSHVTHSNAPRAMWYKRFSEGQMNTLQHQQAKEIAAFNGKAPPLEEDVPMVCPGKRCFAKISKADGLCPRKSEDTTERWFTAPYPHFHSMIVEDLEDEHAPVLKNREAPEEEDVPQDLLSEALAGYVKKQEKKKNAKKKRKKKEEKKVKKEKKKKLKQKKVTTETPEETAVLAPATPLLHDETAEDSEAVASDSSVWLDDIDQTFIDDIFSTIREKDASPR